MAKLVQSLFLATVLAFGFVPTFFAVPAHAVAVQQKKEEKKPTFTIGSSAGKPNSTPAVKQTEGTRKITETGSRSGGLNDYKPATPRPAVSPKPSVVFGQAATARENNQQGNTRDYKPASKEQKRDRTIVPGGPSGSTSSGATIGEEDPSESGDTETRELTDEEKEAIAKTIAWLGSILWWLLTAYFVFWKITLPVTGLIVLYLFGRRYYWDIKIFDDWQKFVAKIKNITFSRSSAKHEPAPSPEPQSYPVSDIRFWQNLAPGNTFGLNDFRSRVIESDHASEVQAVIGVLPTYLSDMEIGYRVVEVLRFQTKKAKLLMVVRLEADSGQRWLWVQVPLNSEDTEVFAFQPDDSLPMPITKQGLEDAGRGHLFDGKELAKQFGVGTPEGEVTFHLFPYGVVSAKVTVEPPNPDETMACVVALYAAGEGFNPALGIPSYVILFEVKSLEQKHGAWYVGYGDQLSFEEITKVAIGNL